ncbi:MAG: phage/plasmid primase, P4 family [Burkholderiaceae bacterium]
MPEPSSQDVQTRTPKINIKRALVEQERQLLAEHHFAVGGGSRLWMFKEGRYSPDAIKFLQKWVRLKWTGGLLDENWDPSFPHRIAQSISALSPSLWERPPYTQLNVLNGLLHSTSEDKWVFRPHDPGWLSPIQLPVHYDPAATCPHWEELQDELFPDASETGITDPLFKIVAWLMGPEGHGSQVAVLLLGEYGGEGKSTVINAIQAFLGDDNFLTSNLVSLQHNRFTTAYIQNKLAIICPDMPTSVMRETEVFKKVVTCDFIQAEYKGGEQFMFRPWAKVLCAGNRIPSSTEGGDAWKRRWFPISFHKKPKHRRTPAEMASRLHSPSELSGVFNRALAYYLPIQRTGIPLTPQAMLEAQEALDQRDPLQNWILSHCAFTVGAACFKAEVYRAYLLWCEQRGQSPLSDRAFGYQITKLFPKAKTDKGPRQEDGSRPLLWVNLSFR